MTFKKVEQHELKDIQTQGSLWEHEETGAQVLLLQNEDSNKSFTIGFRTPPHSDNGITHIIEHSVLNGSKKYPSKEPFVELIKGSLNTFVNAITYSDKTVYPIASTNHQDFLNLLGVYLDAVFAPNFLHEPQILAQEGWHYHLEDPSDALTYRGVVYNEMKGASASSSRQLYNQVKKELYPGTFYAYDSGGSPLAIPSLEQDEFVAYHQKHYHPSNSLTVVYGDFDQEAVFSALEEYFAGQGQGECIELKSTYVQKEPQSLQTTYSISEGEDPTAKDHLGLAWHISEANQHVEWTAMEILGRILFGNNEAPLKKALLEEEIGGDISASFNAVGYPGMFLIEAEYSSAEKMERFKEIVEETLTRLVEEGLPQALIDAEVNQAVFALKEMLISESHPRGIYYTLEALSTWLYGECPFDALSYSAILDEIVKKSKDGYFEQLIKEKLLDNPYRVDVTLVADPGKNDRYEAELAEKLKAYQKELSKDEIEALVEETRALILRQETPDLEADLNKIPRLKREDLSTETEVTPLAEMDLFKDTKMYYSNPFTAGIDYVDLYIDLQGFPQEDYEVLGLLAKTFGKLPTENYSISELDTAIKLHTGGIATSIMITEDQDAEAKAYFIMQGKVLKEKREQLLALMEEILLRTKFSDLRQLKQIIQHRLSAFNERVDWSANQLAGNRVMSQFKIGAKLGEQAGGIEQYYFLKENIDSLDTKFMDKLAQTRNKLAIKERLNAFFVGAEEEVESVKALITKQFAALPSGTIQENPSYELAKRQNEAFITSQDVNYVALGADSTGILPYNGSTLTLGNVLNFNYLWNEVRVQGGAYGVGFRNSYGGHFCFTSYRDPNILKTVDVYKASPQFIKGLDLSEAELVKAIIGTFSILDQPESAYERAHKSLTRHLSGIPQNIIEQLKKELLAVQKDDLTQEADAFKTVLEETQVVVIGNKVQIEQAKETFDALYELY